MIIMLPELWDFMRLINDTSLYEAKQSKQYRLLKQVFSSSNGHIIPPIAIPYWSLFEDTDYIDSLVNDNIPMKFVFDEFTQSFIFKNISTALISIEVIFKKLSIENPNDTTMSEYNNIARRTLQLIRDNSSVDELAGVLNGLNI